ncbi:uncharacterized protein LOC142771306 [Rhipicephalus microplus]|uniref:uncharacterized protein LOC142771306 n=1 Tax=Rhipicephalus microplus TaxID=6941 RepID=UPI003F6B3924
MKNTFSNSVVGPHTLDFSLQVANIVAKAHCVLGFVSRVSKLGGPTTFSLLCQSGVLCRLLYGSLTATLLSWVVRVNKRSGQPELLHRQTKHHSSSTVPATEHELLTIAMSAQIPLPYLEHKQKYCTSGGSC